MFGEINFIFRVYWLLKKSVLMNLVFVQQKNQGRTDRENKIRVSPNFNADLSLFSASVWIFLSNSGMTFAVLLFFFGFSVIVRVFVNVFWSFGTVSIFLWILEWIMCLYFSALFGDRKNSRKIIFTGDCCQENIFLMQRLLS